MNYGNTVLNTKISLLVSFVSGVTFLALLAFVPTKNSGKNNPLIDQKEVKKEILFTNRNLNIKEETFYKIIPQKTLEIEKKEILYYSGISSEVRNLASKYNKDFIRSDIQNFSYDTITYYKNGNLEVSAISDYKNSNLLLEYKYQHKAVDQTIIAQNNQQTLKNVELAYQIHSSISASFKSTQFDIFDERFRQVPTAMGGLNYSNQFFSTGFVAGESNFTNTYRYSQASYLNGNYFYRDVDNFNRDLEKQKSLFEWQTNVTPSKNILLQTAFFNSNKAFINETNASEGARLSFIYGFKYFLVNLKYNFLTDNLVRAVTRPDIPSANNRDFAAFGFTFFLDSAKKISIYLGNNFHNVAVPRIDTNNSIPSQTSFSASIRGKTNDNYNTTFFLNFKNNFNREYFYSNIGVFRIPISSQLNFDYATALGLELSF